MKKVIYFAPICEWNDFVTFNMYLSKIRKDYEIIGVVIPRKAIFIITEADFFITLEDKYMVGSDYPETLERIGDVHGNFVTDIGVFPKHVRNTGVLFEMGYQAIKMNDECFPDYEIKFYEAETNLYKKNSIEIYKELFANLKTFLSSGKTIKPTKEVFESIANKYQGSFKKDIKNYILLTRNFQNKAVDENTINLIPNLQQIIKKVTESGINIINIGFPAQKYNITNKFYQELKFESLTQEELVCLMYLADGVLLSGRSGGFAAHVISNADLFMLYPEWSKIRADIDISIFNDRTKLVGSTDLCKHVSDNNIQKIISILKTHKKIAINDFAEPKEIFYI